jgi:hypothetical protein
MGLGGTFFASFAVSKSMAWVKLVKKFPMIGSA